MHILLKLIRGPNGRSDKDAKKQGNDCADSVDSYFKWVYFDSGRCKAGGKLEAWHA